METLHVSRWRGQTSKAGVKDQASHAQSGQRRQERRDAAEASVEGRVVWKAFGRFGRLAVEEDHACNVFGISARKDPDVLRTGRMADDDEGTWKARPFQQRVEVRRHGHTVLLNGGRIAPTAARAVVRAHSRFECECRRNPSPIGGAKRVQRKQRIDDPCSAATAQIPANADHRSSEKREEERWPDPPERIDTDPTRLDGQKSRRCSIGEAIHAPAAASARRRRAAMSSKSRSRLQPARSRLCVGPRIPARPPAIPAPDR